MRTALASPHLLYSIDFRRIVPSFLSQYNRGWPQQQTIFLTSEMARVVVLYDKRSPFLLKEIEEVVRDIRSIVLRVTDASIVNYQGTSKDPHQLLINILREHDSVRYSSLSIISMGEGMELFVGASYYTLSDELPNLLVEKNARLSHLATGGHTLNPTIIAKMDNNVDNEDRVALYKLVERSPGLGRKFVATEVFGNVCSYESSGISQGVLGRTIWFMEQVEDAITRLNLGPDAARAIRKSVNYRLNRSCGRAVVRVSTLGREDGDDEERQQFCDSSSAYLSFNLYSSGNDFCMWDDTIMGKENTIGDYHRHANSIRDRTTMSAPCAILRAFLDRYPKTYQLGS